MHSPPAASRSSFPRLPAAVALTVVLVAPAGMVVGGPAPAVAAVPAATVAITTPVSLTAPVTPLAARGGFRSRPRISPNRPVTRGRPAARRNPNTGRALRNVSRAILQALGIAFLLSLLFGIGSGGSPLGLLVLLGIIALFVVARRRRRHHGPYGYR